jgi:hypothetical protein
MRPDAKKLSSLFQISPRPTSSTTSGCAYEEFFLEDRQVGVIQVELELQSAVGDPSAAAEQDKGLIEHGVKVTPHFPALLGQSPSPCDKTLARGERGQGSMSESEKVA